MNPGIIIASRVDSSRVPRKAFRKINGVSLIEHLAKRCVSTGLEVCVAVPETDREEYAHLRTAVPGVFTAWGKDQDPLARLDWVADMRAFDPVIRVCHDKIFIDPELVRLALKEFENAGADYLYSSEFTPGSGFEIISRDLLERAAERFENVEHVSYAVKALDKRVVQFSVPEGYRSPHRLLVDYPEDLTLLELVLARLGNDCTLRDAIAFLNANEWTRKINALPELTVYTCAYNAEAFIEKCMGSVAEQEAFRRMEYVLVDDFSNDDTPRLMAKFATRFPNVRFIRNERNLGLASSSNVALSEARGNYLLRLDADDYLVGNETLQDLLDEITWSGKDAIYPSNYFGSLNKIQPGWESHHIGGAIFRKSAVNHVKFTGILRGYEGYDFFVRAREQIQIGYYDKPTFFYRQHEGSMSKTNLEERARIRAEIDARSVA